MSQDIVEKGTVCLCKKQIAVFNNQITVTSRYYDVRVIKTGIYSAPEVTFQYDCLPPLVWRRSSQAFCSLLPKKQAWFAGCWGPQPDLEKTIRLWTLKFWEYRFSGKNA